MKIRSITYFADLEWPLNIEALENAGNFVKAAQTAYEEAGYEVQTVRLATTPFPAKLAKASDPIEMVKSIEVAVMGSGFDYLSLGPAQLPNLDSYSLITDLIAATEFTFFSGVMAENENISLAAIKACAKVVFKTAKLDPDGFSNLHFSAVANMPSGSPFFPASYHAGGPDRFAIATEAADLAVNAFENAKTVEEAINTLVSSLEEHGAHISQVAENLVRESGITYGGIDFSLAPFPEDELSIGTALEELGVPALGQHGSLAAVALLANALDKADFPHAGFSGLMLPVLEDARMAQRAAEGVLTIKDLLMYSAVCGTGLDTVPIPGDVTEKQLAAILLDVAALSTRLNKPLTARLMPVPGKKAGDATEFDFPFFANSKVLALNAEPLTGVLAGDEDISLRPLHSDNK